MTLSTLLKTSASTLARGAAGVAGGLALYFALTGQPALAQEAAQPAAPPAIRGEGPALWVVKDADSTLYLFGTVHVLRPTIGWSSPRVEAAFDSADEVWFEISDPDNQAAVMPLVQQYGLSPDKPLSSILTAEEMAELDAAARTVGMSAAQLDPMRPWLAGLTLSVAPLVKAGYDPQSGVELVLKARAEAAGKPIKAFETIDKQIRILATMDEPVQLEFIRQTLEDFDDAVEMLDGMVDAWSRGDVAELDRVVVEDMKDTAPHVYQAILVDRNLDWANQIQTLLQGSGTAFIAVGAAHLAGDDSVQALLAQRGVDVARVAD
ncbi:MAG: TraB/GumN family protein [Brevundimonas sp.]|uniref:TraB/GumN family protein n=1 Tax=Brevundimonas albigilva TaxID=1312364 RepID=A0ABY4SN98_9CAUL|nr:MULTISPECIES: TraB/GumN family protein [Brevundimonas]PZU62297.1 MAG: TraB/GumN family protein [Brevundimonas sp.]URI15718.1 TraB/GumN family protein [Brevundimonas albigilva]